MWPFKERKEVIKIIKIPGQVIEYLKPKETYAHGYAEGYQKAADERDEIKAIYQFKMEGE